MLFVSQNPLRLKMMTMENELDEGRENYESCCFFKCHGKIDFVFIMKMSIFDSLIIIIMYDSRL